MPKPGFIDRMGGRLAKLDQERLQAYVQRLTREVEFLESVFDTVQEGVMVVDSRQRLRYLNHAAVNLLGLPADAVGRPLARFLKGLDWRRSQPSASAGGERRVLRQDLEILYPQQRLLTVYLMPQPGAEGGSIVVLHDVTEARHRTQAQVESEKLEALSLLAAGVAHEIGNPLNSLHIHLQLLRRHCAGHAADRDLQELLDTAQEEANRLHQVLTQFLAAIRSAKPDLTPLRLPPLVADTLHSLEREIRDRGIAAQVKWPEEMPAVFGDAGQLRQAFYNILRNAIQAMSGGGTLTVSAAVDDDYVTLVFADTGMGISPEHIGRIFQPYFTTKAAGSGLGLMIVERIIRANGGLLAVDSEPGRGTTFRVRLPRTSRRIKLLSAPADAAPATATAAAAEPEKKAPAKRRPRSSQRK